MDPSPEGTPNAVKELLDRVLASPRMPSLPAVAAEILDLVEEEEVDLNRIADTVTKDAALAARVLKTVNSSFYGQAYAVGTVSHALVVLGLRAVKTLTLGFSLVDTFNDGAPGSEAFDVNAYWRRGLLTAVAAKQLAEHVRLGSAEECFLGGLLRDVGVMCLYQSLGATYEDVLAEAAAPEGPWGEAVTRAEAEEFGVDHAQLGAELCRRWRLPPLLTTLIEHHHRPQDAPPERRLAASCVHAGGMAAAVFLAGEAEGAGASGASGGGNDRSAAALTRFEGAVGRLAAEAGFPVDPTGLLHQVHQETAELRRLFELPRGGEGDGAALIQRAREAQERVALEAARDAARLEEESGQLREQAELDALTGLGNRRRFDREMAERCAGTPGTPGSPAGGGSGGFALVMVDVDHFKSVNDTHGHDAGDAVLAAVGEALASAEDPGGAGRSVCRLGGEEFGVLLDGLDLLSAARVADGLRARLGGLVVPLPAGGTLSITVSAGVCVGGPGDRPAAVYKACDRALYAAKQGGRDTVRASRRAVFPPAAA